MNADPVILFDGICNLCNNSVQFVINHDPLGKFKFASLQSEAGQRLIKLYNISAYVNDSFILILDNNVYTKSTAALKVAQQLKGPVSLLYGFILVPQFIRNIVYNIISRNRYKWFGKKDACMIPSKEINAKFLN
jgi:predicted DCC family thiol-disulfide oxidoreductase YuxK